MCGAGWKPALGVLGTTAALVALDPYDTPWLQQPAVQSHPIVRTFNSVLSGRKMATLIYSVPLVLWIAGLLLRRRYLWETALLAGEAAGNAEILAISMKHADRRRRPIEVGADGDFTRTWFCTKSHAIDGMGCFPSGHTSAAFAVATVFAERYPAWREIAFGMAGLIGISRLTARAHFPSDVFFGAALGYSISHYVVLRREGLPFQAAGQATRSPVPQSLG